MAQAIDPSSVYSRGLEDPALLDPDELIVYVAMELETYADMEGWPHFFTTDKLQYYPMLKRALAAAGDSQSLAVLASYESHLASRGVPFTAEAIDEFLCSAGDADFVTDPDWREAYSAASTERWGKLALWFASRGRELVV